VRGAFRLFRLLCGLSVFLFLFGPYLQAETDPQTAELIGVIGNFGVIEPGLYRSEMIHTFEKIDHMLI